MHTDALTGPSGDAYIARRCRARGGRRATTLSVPAPVVPVSALLVALQFEIHQMSHVEIPTPAVCEITRKLKMLNVDLRDIYIFKKSLLSSAVYMWWFID